MKKQPHHRYPQTLIDFQHLEGGQYGNLRMIARDRDTLEIQLGSDFVRINADGASQIAQALECFSGAPQQLIMEVDDETDVVVEPISEEPKLPRPRRAPRRRPSV